MLQSNFVYNVNVPNMHIDIIILIIIKIYMYNVCSSLQVSMSNVVVFEYYML